jgi:hypothetical protein
MIALSILVSAVHAIRPIVRGGEIWIAAGFGLMGGLACATLLGRLDLGRGSLVTELLGFNVGIELAQLLVVALIMPSLLALSRTQLYPAVRAEVASGGIVLAAAWLAERTTLITVNLLDGVAAALVAHPFILAATRACLAMATWTAPACGTRRRQRQRQHSRVADHHPRSTTNCWATNSSNCSARTIVAGTGPASAARSCTTAPSLDKQRLEARKVLQTYVSKPRRMIGEAPLVTCPTDYELRIQPG